jgi:hypothetical protein
MKRAPLHEQLLRYFVAHALNEQPAGRIRDSIAAMLAAGRWRILSNFQLDDDGRPDPLSLAYEVELPCADGWALLCRVHWTLLGLEMADVYDELASTRHQHEQGIAPYRSPSGWPAMN